MLFDIKKCLQAFSLALDLAELDYFKVNLNHSRRTAYICMMLANQLKLDNNDKSDLYALSILHDNGVALSAIKKVGKNYELMPNHCLEGEKNIRKLPLFTKQKNVIKYHHENYDGTGIFKIAKDEIPLFSQIIHLADSLDTQYTLDKINFKNRKDIENFVKENSNKKFNPMLVNEIIEVMKKERFWADLCFYNIDEVLNRVVPNIKRLHSWEDIIRISDVFMEIIDSKSKFTHSHSTGVSDKIEIMSLYYNFDSEKRKKLKIAANLHDLGKLYVPNEILDKPDKLDDFEFHEVRQHTYYTRLALDKIPGFEDITNWAANHHEKLNGNGYPEGFTEKELDFESRLMGGVDIYQALTEEPKFPFFI